MIDPSSAPAVATGVAVGSRVGVDVVDSPPQATKTRTANTITKSRRILARNPILTPVDGALPPTRAAANAGVPAWARPPFYSTGADDQPTRGPASRTSAETRPANGSKFRWNISASRRACWS